MAGATSTILSCLSEEKMTRLLSSVVAVAIAIAPAVAQDVAGRGLATSDVPQRTANDGNVILSGIPELPPGTSARLQPYQNTRSATFADWTAGGEAIYITTRFAAVDQLHRVDRPGGARRQLTFADEPVRGPTRRPGSEEVLYAWDVGGGESFQLTLLDPATARSRHLTDGTSRNLSPVWSDDGQRLAYTSTRRDGRSNDIWVMNVADTASARGVLEAPAGTFWVATDWDPAGERLLVANYVSITDVRVHLVHVETGQLEPVAGGADRPGAYLPAAFAPGGAGIFVITDEGGEFARLGHMPLPAGPIEIITGDIDWDVDGFVMSQDRRRAAFTVNEGGISRVYLFDPATRGFERVGSLPVGIVGLGEFSPDGRHLGLTLNSPDSPSDVYTLELSDGPLGHGPLTRWTHSEVGGLDPSTFVTPELIHYPTFDGRDIPAFVYRPLGGGPHPVVIRIHGGPEGQSRPGFSSVNQSWVQELGIAVLDPNVRGSSGYGRTFVGLDDGVLREDAVRDIGALLDWIASQPDLDQNRVMVYGGSYGGYMVLASLVHYGDRLRGGVNMVGISDFISFLENTEAYRRDLRRAEYGDERDPEMQAFFERISPLRNAHRIRSPLFVIHGHNDPRVPVTEAEQIVQEVRASGRPVWYMNALNEGHGFARRDNQDLMRDLVVLFFQEHLLALAAGSESLRRHRSRVNTVPCTPSSDG
jgi:dipeptidyl aminopeptidase/acylaminoacyl peptidase